MKKVFFTTFCLLALLATGTGLKAQEITITLNHGWTWISYTRADTLTFAEAMGYFTPSEGDVIKSQYGFASYQNGQWSGSITRFFPGLGYTYKSNRTETVSFVYTHAYLPEVSTGDVSAITTASATVGGNFLNDGGATMRQCGICWGTNENPTINNNVVLVEELTTGEYALELTSLVPGTTYHARAFATNNVGTTYGEDVSFTTTFVLPTVTTDEASWVTTTTAIVGGQFSFEGNCFVTEYGVCYRTEEGTETCIADTTNANPFSMTLTDLLPNTTYIVRAYATNGAGTAYGEEKTFTTLEEPPAFPNGAINSKFTVNAYNGQVYFSQGNLQYIGSAAEPYWKFAEYQWEYIGNSQANTAQDIDRDLFCWGTSGYDHGANHYQPWSCGGSNSDYYAYGDMAYHLYDQTGQADWGYNAISNGGNEENMGWRTLSQAEWLYLFNTRSTTSGIRFARAQVNGVGGAILLPDDWDATIYGLNDVNNLGASMSSNIITADVWADTFEANGAVFLPIAGWMAIWDNYTFYSNPGAYWSSTAMNSSTAWYFDVYESGIEFNDNHDRGHKRSVRLAMNAAPVKPTVTTLNPTRITDTTAIAKGRITDYGGAMVTACGICYRTEQGTETCIASDTITNTFSVNLEGLTPNTTYIVRAYATNEAGTGYGEEVTFTTLAEAPTLVGYLDGRFSINADGGQVHFSQGNLQYIGSAAEPYWKFADYQWGYIGSSQANAAQNTDRDLFGWGTSGYDHGANCYQPWSTSQNIGDYYLYGQSTCNLYDQTGQADWGYNAITNGGNIEDIGWRTLTSSEWSYIFETRAASTVNGTANARYAKAKVADVQGMILFPDEYVHPDGVAQPIGINEGWGSTGWYGNNYSEEAFSLMEANGAVFLPVAGYRSGTTLYDVTGGLYWSSSYYYNEKEYTVYFNSGSLYTPGADYRYWGCSVRLVLDAAIAPPTVTTLNVTGITNTTAIVGGRITDYGGALATECGICYRTEEGTETCVASQETGSTFSVALQDLTPNTTYIVRAYATNDEGTGYGEEVTFTTLDEGNEHEYVDLGLPSGLLWATCNVGADTPEEYGDYFAWGETTPKDVYSWSTYLYSNGNSSTPTKYTESDGLTILQPEDDAATANWGNGWRMPTKEEWEELYQSTTHIWTTQNGVHGRLFTGSNGNSIFLPAAGSYDGSSLTEGGVCGSYWSSSLRIPQVAWDYYFGSSHSYMGMGGTRFYGESVRAVRNAE